MKKGKKKLLVCAGVLIFTLVILLFFPIKLAIRYENIDKERPYLICRQQSTTGPNWLTIGDNTGLFEDDDIYEVIINGVDPQFVLNNSLQIDSPNNIYIIYGEITTTGDFYGATYPTVDSKGFDMIFPIERGASLRFFVPSKYLTLLDYNWLRQIE